jgi:transcriptional regulator
MYIPKHFTAPPGAALELINKYPFATVICSDADGLPLANHFPLLATLSGGAMLLEGHMAKQNSQWTHFQKGPKVLAIFHGPHTYITPQWYSGVGKRDVPTWNYVSVHVTGRVRLVEDFEGLTASLKKLSDHFEAGTKNPWTFELPANLADAQKLTSAIVGFEIEVEKIETKLKISQNRLPQDREGVIKGLESRTDEMSGEIRRLMIEIERTTARSE